MRKIQLEERNIEEGETPCLTGNGYERQNSATTQNLQQRTGNALPSATTQNLEEPGGDALPDPCQYFDFMIGTSTGG